MNNYNDCSNNTDWRILATVIPKEIVGFMKDVFQIYDIRAKVGTSNGVHFSVRSNESNHSMPHIHAKYAEYEVSISIADARVLAGNLPVSQQRIAQEWVKLHKEELLGEWSNRSISATSMMTRSRLDFVD